MSQSKIFSVPSADSGASRGSGEDPLSHFGNGAGPVRSTCLGKSGVVPPLCPPRLRRQGFSLVELLVVIGIIAVLIAILLPVLGRAQEQSRRTACLSNLRSLGAALFMYANRHNDRLPNGNPPGVWVDYNGSNEVMVAFAETDVKAPGVFRCPADRDPAPHQIVTADQALPDSARVSYEFYSLYFAPEHGPVLSKLRGRAPLAWDVDGGGFTPTGVQNHGVKGGNVLFADGHAAWQNAEEWDDISWPHPADEFYPYE